MASPVTRYPTTDTPVSGTWSNPTSVQADDGAVAAITRGTTKNSQDDREQAGYGFDAAIPAGATINSVAIEVKHRVATTANICHLENFASVGASDGAVNDDTLEPTTLTARQYAAYARPGGGPWTRDDLLDANFKTTIRARNGNNASSNTWEWDYIRVVVDYTEAGVTLTVQDGAIGLAAEVPSLTQANTLAVQDALIALGAESPALVQANVLAIQDALIALAAESPTLEVGGITLTVQDGVIALAAETPALTQANVLAVAEAAVALAAESPALTQANLLAVADAAIALAAESPGLTQAHVLAVQDGAITLTVDPVTLLLSTLLEVADAAIAVVADQVALTQANQLAVADALISLAGENPALIQAHVLSVNDAAIALVAENVVLVLPTPPMMLTAEIVLRARLAGRPQLLAALAAEVTAGARTLGTLTIRKE